MMTKCCGWFALVASACVLSLSLHWTASQRELDMRVTQNEKLARVRHDVVQAQIVSCGQLGDADEQRISAIEMRLDWAADVLKKMAQK